MTTINKLSDIYVKWIDKNKLAKMSADEVLIENPNLTVKQSNWLKKFIEIWDMTQNNDSQIRLDTISKKDIIKQTKG